MQEQDIDNDIYDKLIMISNDTQLDEIEDKLPDGIDHEICDDYKGDKIDGMRCGYGVMYYALGDIYEGNWLNDHENGQGIMTYMNGDIYNGSWYNGMRTGNGKITYFNGSTYEGTFYEDKRNGYGKLVDIENSYTYEGQWKDDEMYDSGTIYYNNGDTYIGKIAKGEPNGSGRMNFSNYDHYSGMWKNGKHDGIGTITFSSGDVYSGNWVDGLYEGHGIYTSNTGDIYDGNWFRGERSGMCKFTFSSGNRYIGIWNQYCSDVISSNGIWTDYCFNENSLNDHPATMIYKNNDIYVGSFVDKKRDGYGIMEYNTGDIYDGFWSNNAYNGTGTYKYTNGDMYVGEWCNSMKHGSGTITYKNGDTYNGKWCKDKMIDDGIYFCKEYEKEYLYIHVEDNKASIWHNDRQIYLGEHKDLIKNGNGEEYEEDGTSFIGMFVDGKREQGVITLDNGKEKLKYACYYNKEGVPHKILKPSDVKSSESKLFIQFCKVKRERDNVNKEVERTSKKFKKIVKTVEDTVGSLTSIVKDKEIKIERLDNELKKKNKQIAKIEKLEKFIDTEQSKDTDDVPRILTCPITLELMKDPVICTDQITYERSAIQSYINGMKRQSPVNRLYVNPNFIVPNQAVRDMIETWCKVSNQPVQLEPIRSTPHPPSAPQPSIGRGRGVLPSSLLPSSSSNSNRPQLNRFGGRGRGVVPSSS